MQDRYIRWPEIRQITGLSRTTVWRLERNGNFPARRQLAFGNSVGWLQSELTTWIETRITPGGKS